MPSAGSVLTCNCAHIVVPFLITPFTTEEIPWGGCSLKKKNLLMTPHQSNNLQIKTYYQHALCCICQSTDLHRAGLKCQIISKIKSLEGGNYWKSNAAASVLHFASHDNIHLSESHVLTVYCITHYCRYTRAYYIFIDRLSLQKGHHTHSFIWPRSGRQNAT